MTGEMATRSFQRRLFRLAGPRGTPSLLILPTVAFLGIFLIYPLVNTVYLSLHDLTLTRSMRPRWVGLENYAYLLFEDANFWPIVGHTFFWVAGSAVLQFLLGLPTALLLNGAIPFRGLWRGIVLIPWVTPVVVAGIAWRWIFDGEWGIANYYLVSLGLLPAPVVWLGDSTWVWPALLLASAWKGFPYMALMLLAGLQGIQKELYEAAQCDGAGPWRRFVHVTMPGLRPVIYVTVLITLVTTWTKFELIWALTQGGPGFATSILPTYIYTQSFLFYKMGLGATAATLSAVLVVVFTFLYTRRFRPQD